MIFLIGIGINSTISVGIDQHWALIGGVLTVAQKIIPQIFYTSCNKYFGFMYNSYP